MKIFLKKLAFFFIPIILYVIIVLSLDIFKIFKDYNNYYNQDITTLNRTYVFVFIKERGSHNIHINFLDLHQEYYICYTLCIFLTKKTKLHIINKTCC